MKQCVRLFLHLYYKSIFEEQKFRPTVVQRHPNWLCYYENVWICQGRNQGNSHGK